MDCYYGADDTTPDTYYYVLNLQGDVIQLRDENDVVAVNYTYDAWGKILSVSNASNANIVITTHISNLNPFKYRGYFYDIETGFYYCNSRYYDPQMRRFVNADEYVSTGQGYIGYNMFAYCMNNPVNMLDFSGNWPRWATIALGTVAAVAAVAVTVATLGAAAPAAAFTLTTVGMSIGASYTVASTAATVAVVGTTVMAATYAGDMTYAAITGDSLLLDTVFQGNTEAYSTGAVITSMATAGMLEMAAQSPQTVTPKETKTTASHTSGVGSPKNNINPGGSYTKLDNNGNLYSYTQFDDIGRQTMRMDFQGKPHANVLPHIHLYTYPQQGGRMEYVFDLDWKLIN